MYPIQNSHYMKLMFGDRRSDYGFVLVMAVNWNCSLKLLNGLLSIKSSQIKFRKKIFSKLGLKTKNIVKDNDFGP